MPWRVTIRDDKKKNWKKNDARALLLPTLSPPLVLKYNVNIKMNIIAAQRIKVRYPGPNEMFPTIY